MKTRQSGGKIKISIYNLISIGLKSISQVIFVENVISGLVILITILAFDYKLGVITFLSGILGSLVGYLGGADEEAVYQGLYGFNSVLLAMALFLFLEGSNRWIIALVAASFAPLPYGAMGHILRKVDIPVLTFPFISLTWVVLLSSYHLKTIRLGGQMIPQDLANWSLQVNGSIDYIGGLINGIGQVYFQTNIWAGLLVLGAVFWDSWRMGIYTILGAIIGWTTALALGVEVTPLNLGLYSYNAVLTAITLYIYKDKSGGFGPIIGILGAMATIPIVAGLNTLFKPYGIPSLTMPFVLVAWIFIGAKKTLTRL